MSLVANLRKNQAVDAFDAHQPAFEWAPEQGEVWNRECSDVVVPPGMKSAYGKAISSLEGVAARANQAEERRIDYAVEASVSCGQCDGAGQLV